MHNIKNWKLEGEELTLGQAPEDNGRLWLDFEDAVEGFTTRRIYNIAIKGIKEYNLPLELQQNNKITAIRIEYSDDFFGWTGG